jgi:hypothetical protein
LHGGVALPVVAVVRVDVVEEDGESAGAAEDAHLVPALLRLVEVLELPRAPVGGHLQETPLELRAAAAREAVAHVAAQQLVGATLQELLGRGVQVGETTPAVQAVDGVGKGREEIGLGPRRPVVVLVCHRARSPSPAVHRPA